MFTGSMVALVTPMSADGTIDWQALETLIEWQIQQGTDAIVSVGTTGESATLSHDEHKAVIRFSVECVNKRVPVIAGAGANATKEAIDLTFSAYQGGCDATLQVVPYYNKPPQSGLYRHFSQIAQSVPLPLLLYNVPGRTSCDLLPETVVELAKIKNIVGIKEASTYERLEILRQHFPRPSNFSILCGEDGISARAVCSGLIDGVISVTANIAPKQMHDLIDKGLKGDESACLALNQSIATLHEAMFTQTNPMPVKWALQRMGKIDNGIRLPLVELDEEHQSIVEKALQQAKIL
ncbi:4-hydroxy-tetrahydrodipicolinate synthase [Rappaport israeli]|uniref:4-hydroxy-tetrahydrodipicolinate synthase n=1 Tax=Rappaport israeli TaxID=1839807 RepID=UPI000931EF4E|nr:4-hydroxy-tetrahydrodipicolinate synthase [Rappaport israeli]